MAGTMGTLGTPSRVGVVMPMKWWFDRQKAALPIPTPAPPPGAPGPSDEPPAAKPIAAAPAAAAAPAEQTRRGGGTIATRDAIAGEQGAGAVDDFGTFMKDVALAPAGPIGAAAFMGRLALSGLRTRSVGPVQVSGPPGATDVNSNSVPGQTAAQESAAQAGVSRAALAQMGADALKKLRQQQNGKGGASSPRSQASANVHEMMNRLG